MLIQIALFCGSCILEVKKSFVIVTDILLELKAESSVLRIRDISQHGRFGVIDFITYKARIVRLEMQIIDRCFVNNDICEIFQITDQSLSNPKSQKLPYAHLKKKEYEVDNLPPSVGLDLMRLGLMRVPLYIAISIITSK